MTNITQHLTHKITQTPTSFPESGLHTPGYVMNHLCLPGGRYPLHHEVLASMESRTATHSTANLGWRLGWSNALRADLHVLSYNQQRVDPTTDCTPLHACV